MLLIVVVIRVIDYTTGVIDGIAIKRVKSIKLFELYMD